MRHVREWSILMVAIMALAGVHGVGCSTGESTTTDDEIAQGQSVGDEAATSEAGTLLFEANVDEIRRTHYAHDHVYQQLGWTWDQHLERLEGEFEDAETSRELVVALTRLNNSLHNPHCRFRTGMPQKQLYPGLTVGMEWVDDEPVFFAEEVYDSELEDRISPGMIVAAIEDVEADDFLREFALYSNANNRFAMADELSRIYFSRRHTNETLTEVGERETWTWEDRDSQERVDVEMEWRVFEGETRGGGDEQSPEASESEMDEEPQCSGVASRQYPEGYELVEVGENFCLYASDHPEYRAYPILRHHSFWYGGDDAAVEADYELLEASLDAMSALEAVMIDLRDNAGGNNPNTFVDWWTTETYVDQLVRYRLVPEFTTAQDLEQTNLFGPHIGHYLEFVEEMEPTDELSPPVAFFCQEDTCKWDNSYSSEHQVTDHPFVLLIGPRCASSCEAFTMLLHEHDLTTTVGEPMSASSTIFRHNIAVEHPETREPLGELCVGFSDEVSSVTGETIEGRPLEPDVYLPRRFDNRERYDELLIDAGIEALER